MGRGLSQTNKILLGSSGVFVLVGVALLEYFTTTSGFEELPYTRTRESEQFLALLFLVVWIAAAMEVRAQLKWKTDTSSTAMFCAGSFASIMVFAFPFNALGHVFIHMNDHKQYVLLAVGGLLSYLGAFIAFLVPARLYYQFQGPPNRLAVVSTALAVIVGLSGCVLIWATSGLDFVSDVGAEIFEMTNGIMSILLILTIGVIYRTECYCYTAVVLNTMSGFPVLHNFLQVHQDLKDNFSNQTYIQILAGSVLLFVSSLFVFVANIRALPRDPGYTPISG